MEHRADLINGPVTLMIWDTNPMTFNDQGKITCVNSKVPISQGDIILIKQDKEFKVVMEVVEIISKKNSSMKGYEYYTLKTNRKIKNY